MSKVFTGNVFISTSRQAIEKLFFSKDKLPTLSDKILTLDDEELKRSLIVTPQRNSNLISFDYSFGSVNSDSNFLQLKFVETDELFEFFYVNKSVASTLLTKLLKELKYYNNTIAGREYKRDIEKSLFDADARTILNDGKIYFSFGVGEDLQDWAGPFVANLMGSNLEESADGVREITLKYTTTSPFFLSNMINTELENGLESAINKYKRSITNSRFIAARAEIEVEIKDLEKNIHFYVNKLITSYLKTCSNNSEVITLIPNLNLAYTLKKINTKATGGAALTEIANRRRNTEFTEKFFKDLNIDVNFITDGIKELLPIAPEVAQERSLRILIGKVKLSMDTKKQIIPAENGFPDFFWPIYNIINYYGQIYASLVNDGGLVSDFEFYEESNIKILKLWKKYGFINDDTRPVIIFGSLQLIKNILYLSNITDFDSLLQQPSNINFVYKDDSDKYYNRSYRVDYFNQFIKTPISSSFKEQVIIKDELALPEFNKQFIDFAGIPVFRYNLPNSNVLGLNVQYNDTYTGIYNLGFKVRAMFPLVNANLAFVKSEIEKDFTINKTLLKTLEKSISGIPGVLPESLNGLVGLVSYWYDFSLNPAGRQILLNPTSKENTKKLDRREIIIYLSLLVNSNLKLGLSLSKPFIEINGSEDVYLQNELLKNLETIALQVRIKTLPFFKLSGPNILGGKRVILLGSNNTIIGSEGKKRLMPYSGMYIINEFRHVIDESDMYSEFTLSKIIEAGLPDFGINFNSEAVGEVREKIKALSNEVGKNENNS